MVDVFFPKSHKAKEIIYQSIIKFYYCFYYLTSIDSLACRERDTERERDRNKRWIKFTLKHSSIRTSPL